MRMNNGHALDFWMNTWAGTPMAEVWPHLHCFALKQIIPVYDMFQTEDLTDLFHLPLSDEAYTQFQELENIIQGLEISHRPMSITCRITSLQGLKGI